MTWMVIAKVCFAFAWMLWLVSVPFWWVARALLWGERRLTMAGVRATIRATGVARPLGR